MNMAYMIRVLHEYGIHDLAILIFIHDLAILFHGILDLNYYMNISWLPYVFSNYQSIDNKFIHSRMIAYFLKDRERNLTLACLLA